VDKVEEQILSVYRKFWVEALPSAYAAERAARRAILEPVMVDPALSEWLVSMVKLDRAGQQRVGQAVLLTQKAERKGNVAVVKGCLDTYNVGKIDVESGRFLGRGLRREAVRVWLVRSDDGAWRVSGTLILKDPRC
jgi:DNA helicase TIP49 (TBP-interacting protein)